MIIALTSMFATIIVDQEDKFHLLKMGEFQPELTDLNILEAKLVAAKILLSSWKGLRRPNEWFF